MSTTPLTDSINTLIARANGVTGASDTTLSQVFTTLVAGNGGSSSTIADFITVTGNPLTDIINALVAYSNSVTGASDTTASDAINTLISGYSS